MPSHIPGKIAATLDGAMRARGIEFLKAAGTKVSILTNGSVQIGNAPPVEKPIASTLINRRPEAAQLYAVIETGQLVSALDSSGKGASAFDSALVQPAIDRLAIALWNVLEEHVLVAEESGAERGAHSPEFSINLPDPRQVLAREALMMPFDVDLGSYVAGFMNAIPGFISEAIASARLQNVSSLAQAMYPDTLIADAAFAAYTAKLPVCVAIPVFASCEATRYADSVGRIKRLVSSEASSRYRVHKALLEEARPYLVWLDAEQVAVFVRAIATNSRRRLAERDQV